MLFSWQPGIFLLMSLEQVYATLTMVAREYLTLIWRWMEFVVQMPPALDLQCKMLQGLHLWSHVSIPPEVGSAGSGLASVGALNDFLFRWPHTVVFFSKSSSSDIHIGKLASFELCLFSSLEAALLSRTEFTDSVSLLSAGEALSWARPFWVSSCLPGMQVWWPNR